MFGTPSTKRDPETGIGGHMLKSDDAFDRITYETSEDVELFAEHELDDEENTAIHRMLLSYYSQEIYVQSAQRSMMAKDEAYFDGDQWSEDDKATLMKRGQVPLVFNVIAPAVNWLLGTQRRSRTQSKVLPRTSEGSKPAERKTKLMKYVADASRTEHHHTRAFTDAVRVGIGWIEDGYQGEDGGEPIYTRSESWRNIIYDSRATELDLEDARFVMRAKWTDYDVAAKIFPEREYLLQRSATTNLDLGTLALEATSDTHMDALEEAASSASFMGVGAGFGYANRRRVRLIECWYKKPAETDVIKGGEFSGEIFDPMSRGHVEGYMAGKFEVRQRIKMRVHLAVMTEKGLLYNSPSPYRHNKYPFTPIWGNRRGSDGMPYGLIRNMVDIQQDLNKRASKALHILSTSKIIMDKGAVDDVDELAEEAAQPDAIIEKKKGYELRIDQGKDLAAPHMDLMSRGIEMIQQMSGITDEAMGRTTNATSGKAIIARQNQGSVAVAHFLDNLRVGLVIHGEKNLSLIEQYMDEKKQFRITNTRGTPDYIDINDGRPENDISATKADFVISEDDWNATMRQAAVQELMDVLAQLAPGSPEIVMLLLDLVVDSMDIPSKDEIVSRIRQFTNMEDPDADPNDPDPEAEQRRAVKELQAQMQKRAADAEIALKEASAADKAASAQERGARAAKTGIEVERAAEQLIETRLANIEKALTTALMLMQNRVAAPLADQLADQAALPTPVPNPAPVPAMAQPSPPPVVQQQPQLQPA